MSFLRKIALYIYLCVYVCANLYIRDANKYFNISLSYPMSKKTIEGFLQFRKNSGTVKNTEKQRTRRN